MIFVTVVVDQLYIMFWVLSVLNLSYGLFLQTLILCGGGLLKILVIVFFLFLFFAWATFGFLNIFLALHIIYKR